MEKMMGCFNFRAKICHLLVPLMAMILSSCGTTGGTTRAAVQLDAMSISAPVRPVVLTSLDREDEGIRLMSVGVFAWGKFDNEDQSNIKASLTETLGAVTSRYASSSGEPIQTYVLIRKYFVGASNNAAAVFAGVDWAAVGSSNQVLFQESFYATGDCRLTCTLGGLKDSVNLAIIKRIAQRAVVVASGRNPGPTDVPGTHSTFESAVATMPSTLKSWNTLLLNRAPTILVAGGIPEKLAFDWAEMRTPVDWNKRLQGASR